MCNIKKNYCVSVSIINTINNMILSNSNTYKFPYYDGSIDKMNRLIEHQTGISTDTNEEEDQYEYDLFSNFCFNIEGLKFNMIFMKKHKLYVHSVRQIQCWGFKKLYNKFFNEELDVVDLTLVFQLFRNVSQVTIEKWKISRYETSPVLSEELMKFVLRALSTPAPETFTRFTISLLTVMSEKNDQCPVAHALSAFVTDEDGYTCDRCRKSFNKHTKMYVCFEKETGCDYAICGPCFEKPNRSVVYLKQAIDKYETIFKEIYWDIRLEKHKNEAKQISDAICFVKC
eukprot:156716_1